MLTPVIAVSIAAAPKLYNNEIILQKSVCKLQVSIVSLWLNAR